MSKFDTKSRTAVRTRRPQSPVVSQRTPGSTATTYNGAPGFERDAKSELFLLAVTNMVSEDTFYESASARDSRYSGLIQQVTKEDPDWVARMLKWLRADANMRSAPIAGAVEYVFAGGPNGRRVIDSVCLRADEPAEVMAYATMVIGKHTVPKSIKRGVADAARRLYNERNALKYDGNSRNWRMADVLQVAHVKPGADWQSALFKWLLDARYNSVTEIPEELRMIHARRVVEQVPVSERRAFLERARLEEGSLLREAGMTWESLSGWLQGPMDQLAWESVIPQMGYMALLRNLRNFDQAGVSENVAQTIAQKLADPDEVRRSRQFPMRFLSAYRAAPSLRWSWPLEQALQLSLENVPVLKGSTLILVDRSGSMFGPLSARSDLNRADAAAVFGSALALRCEAATLVEFGSRSQTLPVRTGESVLKMVERFGSLGGTNTAQAVQQHYAGHDRVVCLTDEQANAYYGNSVYGAVPADKFVFTFNLAGYRHGASESGAGRRHTFGGLTDAGFKMIPILEAAQTATWPF